MADRHLVLAVFPDEPAADSAAAALKDSDIAHKQAIGVLALDSDGKLKQDKVGKRSAGKGAAIGGVIAVFSTALLGPAVLAGAAVGALHHKNLGLSDADKARLTVDLNAGKAAVAVMSHPDTAPASSHFLTQRGGTPEGHELTDDRPRGRRDDGHSGTMSSRPPAALPAAGTTQGSCPGRRSGPSEPSGWS